MQIDEEIPFNENLYLKNYHISTLRKEIEKCLPLIKVLKKRKCLHCCFSPEHFTYLSLLKMEKKWSLFDRRSSSFDRLNVMQWRWFPFCFVNQWMTHRRRHQFYLFTSKIDREYERRHRERKREGEKKFSKVRETLTWWNSEHTERYYFMRWQQ